MRHFTRHISIPLLLLLGAALIAALVTSASADAQPPLAPADAAATIWTPYDSVRFAWSDADTVAKQSAQRASYRRYLSLYHLPPSQRAGYAKACSFLLNSLSREKAITVPGFVPDSEQTVIAFQLDDYQIDPEIWDKLAAKGSGPADSAQPDPYFQARFVKVEEEYEWYGTPDGYGGYRDKYKKYTGKKIQHVELGPAPWLLFDGGVAWKGLTAATKTDHPILRADWFLAMASWAPLYYDFLGLGKTSKDFEALVFADEELARKAHAQVKGVVTFSPVALHNRTLTRTPTLGRAVGGYYWESHDTNKSIADRDYINVLLDEKFDATEVIATLRNGLQAYFLTDANGNRLDVAVAGIAQDHETGLQDHQVFSGRNCMTCHAKGIRPIDDEVRALADMRKQLTLLVADGDEHQRQRARRIQDLYFTDDLDEAVKLDQAFFEAAIQKATGTSGAVNGAFFARAIIGYLDQPVTPELMAAETGVPLAQLDDILKRAIGIDHTLVGAIPRPPRPARRDQWEQSFAQIQDLILRDKNDKKEARKKK